MDRQLDADGGAVLSRVVRGIGARLVLGRFVVARHAPTGGGPAHVVLDDGSVLPADLVVLAAGVRSRTELAAAMGLQVDRAVVVDDRLATSVAHVDAIGECAQHRGEVAGLVQPGWDHARVLADVLTGADAEATYEGTSVLTRLKAPDIDLASRHRRRRRARCGGRGARLHGPEPRPLRQARPAPGASRRRHPPRRR